MSSYELFLFDLDLLVWEKRPGREDNSTYVATNRKAKYYSDRSQYTVCVTQTNSSTYEGKTMKQIYYLHETRKMKRYNIRILLEWKKGYLDPSYIILH